MASCFEIYSFERWKSMELFFFGLNSDNSLKIKKGFKRLDLIRPTISLKKTENNFGKAESIERILNEG